MRLVTVHGRHPERPDWTWCGRLLAHVATYHWHIPEVRLVRCEHCERVARKYSVVRALELLEPEQL